MKIKALLLSVCLATVTILSGCGSTSAPANQGTTGDSSQQEQQGGSTGGAALSNLKFASNNQGSAWYIYAATIAELLRPALDGTSVDVLPLAGGIGNTKMLADSKADVAFAFSITGKWAYEGSVAYDAKQENLRALVGGLDQYYIGIVASKSFVDKNGVKTIKDIADKKLPVRLYTNNKGTLAEFATSQVMEAYGLSYDDIKGFGGKVELTSNDIITSSFQNGEADLHILVMPKSHPTISEISVQTPIVFLPMEDEIVEGFKQFGYIEAALPKGSFKDQDSDVNTVGFSTVVLTTAELNEDLAYTITKVINENKAELDNAHEALKDFNPQNSASPEKLNVPLHPGAEKYYKEVGVLN